MKITAIKWGTEGLWNHEGIGTFTVESVKPTPIENQDGFEVASIIIGPGTKIELEPINLKKPTPEFLKMMKESGWVKRGKKTNKPRNS